MRRSGSRSVSSTRSAGTAGGLDELERNGLVLRRRLDLHGKAEVLETSNEPSGDLGVISTLEIVGAEFMVGDLLLQDVVRGGQDGGGDGEDRLLGASPALETKKLRTQVRVT